MLLQKEPPLRLKAGSNGFDCLFLVADPYNDADSYQIYLSPDTAEIVLKAILRYLKTGKKYLGFHLWGYDHGSVFKDGDAYNVLSVQNAELRIFDYFRFTDEGLENLLNRLEIYLFGESENETSQSSLQPRRMDVSS